MRAIGFAVAAMACVALAEPAMAQQQVAFDIAAGPLDTTPLHPHTLTLAVDARF